MEKKTKSISTMVFITIAIIGFALLFFSKTFLFGIMIMVIGIALAHSVVNS